MASKLTPHTYRGAHVSHLTVNGDELALVPNAQVWLSPESLANAHVASLVEQRLLVALATPEAAPPATQTNPRGK